MARVQWCEKQRQLNASVFNQSLMFTLGLWRVRLPLLAPVGTLVLLTTRSAWRNPIGLFKCDRQKQRCQLSDFITRSGHFTHSPDDLSCWKVTSHKSMAAKWPAQVQDDPTKVTLLIQCDVLQSIFTACQRTQSTEAMRLVWKVRYLICKIQNCCLFNFCFECLLLLLNFQLFWSNRGIK